MNDFRPSNRPPAAARRRPKPQEFAAVIVGTGFAGLGMAIRMKQAGMEDFVVLEKAADVGGTWRDNHYPGCACDVPSHLYSFSFEANPNWSRMYSPQPEIWAYLKATAKKYALTPHIRFGQCVVHAEWDEALGLWKIETAAGASYRARALISGMGGLSRAAIPDLKGLKNFKGKAFHSQDWDHGYEFADKRVAVIGTGASAIQFVPQIAGQVERLDLYQRTPPWIMPKPDRPVSDGERRVFSALPLAQRAFRNALYWVMELRVLGFAINPKIMKLVQRIAKRHIARQIADPELRRKVTPDYTIGCKRVLISDDYYPALARKNVEVIIEGVKEIRANSIVAADGSERAVDAIIFGTGFHATDPLPRGVIKGRDGIDILDAWKDGAEAYLGTTVSGFPNLFLLVGPNTGLGHNSMVFMIESQVQYVMDCLKTMQRRKLRSVDVRPEVLKAFNQGLQDQLGKAIWSVGGCQSWYLDANGRNVTLWPGFTWRFRQLTRRFRLSDYTVDSLAIGTKRRREVA